MVLIGAGLSIYAGGSVYYNVAASGGPAPLFPSVADAMWMSLYPLAFAALGVILRGRFTNLKAAVWLDGVIAGGVVAAVVAAAVFDPVFDITVTAGAASVARLAYPVADLIMVGVAIAAWSIAGRRFDPFWALLPAPAFACSPWVTACTWSRRRRAPGRPATFSTTRARSERC